MSGKVKASTYRRVGSSSTVDESLFGFDRPASKSHEPQPDSGLSDFFSGGGTRRAASQPVNIVTKDYIRTIRVPPTGESKAAGRATEAPLILSMAEFQRLRESASVRTTSALDRERAERTRQRLADQEAAAKRREEMAALARAADSLPSELEDERQQHRLATNKRAVLLLEEQEDEVKQLTELINGAKVHAIREAQLAEKALLEQQAREEQLRLDRMMEAERVAAIAAAERKEREIKEKRQKGANQIRTQIQERELERILADELREQDTQAMLEQLRLNEEYELEQARKKKAETERLLAVVAASNAQAIRVKEERAAQERLEDLKVAAYLREKQAREEAIEQEKEAVKREKEMETKRMLALQERDMDTMAEKHAIAARRQQEAIERAARAQEAAKAAKLAKTVAEVGRAREEQIKAKEHLLSQKQAEDRKAHQRVLEVQKELAQKDAEKAAREKAQRQAYSEGIRSQIQASESDRRQSHEKYFEEGAKLGAEAEARRQRLDDIKQRKLAALKAEGLDSKYLHGVVRAVEHPASTTFS